MNPWLLSLGLSGLKSIADNQANKQQIASNVITQKYSPWTHQQADFSGIGKNNTMSNMMAGAGSALLQDQLNKQNANDSFKFTPTAASQGTSPVAVTVQAAGRAPAVMAGATREPSSSAFEAAPQAQLPDMLQGENPWLSMAQKQPLGPYQAQYPMQAPAVDPTAQNRSNIWAMLPDNMPIKRGY